MPDDVPVSVVVPTRDRPEHLRSCIETLSADLSRADEIIVVDSASTSPRTAEVARTAGTRLVAATARGASLARNIGWSVAAHDIVAFVDDDVRVAPGWSAALVAPFHDDGIAFVTGRVEVPDHQRGVERPVAVKVDPLPARIDRSATGTLGASCNLAVRRRVLDAVGGFDERLGPGTWAASAEDVELFDRLLADGWIGRYEPAALVHHEQWRSRRELLALDWRYGKGIGVRLARLRHLDPERARWIAREVLWEGGVRTIVGDLRRGYEFGVLTVGTRTLATLVGAAVGSSVRPR